VAFGKLRVVITLYRWRGAEPPGGVRLTRLTTALPPTASASAASLDSSGHLTQDFLCRVID